MASPDASSDDKGELALGTPEGDVDEFWGLWRRLWKSVGKMLRAPTRSGEARHIGEVAGGATG